MTKRIVRTVTVTGADDSIRPEELFLIAERYPFAEFGILLSRNHGGNRRFPSRIWLEELFALWKEDQQLTLSAHICGQWVRELCTGNPSFFQEFMDISDMFSRFQLNFHAEKHSLDIKELSFILKHALMNRPVILQMDGENERVFYALKTVKGITPLPLFDKSSGAGIVPNEWPVQIPNQYCGYAGGLSPDNLADEMEKISAVTHDHIWIDAETLLRSNNDSRFDLTKVTEFLKIAEPWVTST